MELWCLNKLEEIGSEMQKRIVINKDLEIFCVFNITEYKIKVHSRKTHSEGMKRSELVKSFFQ
jgi:hypothetical protein